jgi:hypothetical protein
MSSICIGGLGSNFLSSQHCLVIKKNVFFLGGRRSARQCMRLFKKSKPNPQCWTSHYLMFSDSTCSGVSKISNRFLCAHFWVNNLLSMMCIRRDFVSVLTCQLLMRHSGTYYDIPLCLEVDGCRLALTSLIKKEY